MSENINPDDLIEITPDENRQGDEEMSVEEDVKQYIPAKEVKEAKEASGEDKIGEDYTAEDFAEEDDFAEDFAEMAEEESDMAIVEEIGESIVQQMDIEISNTIFEEPESEYGEDVAEASEELYEEDNQEKDGNFFTRIPWWGYMVAGVVLVIAITAAVIFATKAGHGLVIKWGSRYAANHVTYAPVEPVDTVEVQDEKDEITSEDIEVVPDDYTVVTPEITPEPLVPVDEGEEQQVYNILLIGEENLDGGEARGRSDLIMIATLNLKQKSIKLTSVMRDSLVSIPGYSDNKINAAYAIGGVSLLYDTLKQNLGITVDNYMLVNFENFEAIVDALGGIDIDLTVEEARYLNTTNYISKPEYRSVSAGANHLNGNQTLGYCRIRYVETGDGLYNDFGRTARQRTVVSKIYESTAGLSYMGLINLSGKLLPYVTTDLTAEQIESYVNMMLAVNRDKIETFRIPVSGSFGEMRLRDMLVTRIDLDTNAKAFRTFAYGE